LARTEELRAICLAQSLSDGPLRDRVYGDRFRRYSAPDWAYVAQAASNHLVAVMLGILANYATHALMSPRKRIGVADLITREVEADVVSYAAAVERLRRYRAKTTADKKHVDVLLLANNGVLAVLKGENLDGLDLVELCEELNSLTPEQLRRRARRYDR